MDASGWIGAASALVALVALYFTRQQVAQAQAQTRLQRQIHEDAAQPYLWADIRPSEVDGFLMQLVIKNEGPTIATDVVVTFEPPLPLRLTDESRDGARYELAAMPPGRHIRWHLNGAPDWYGSDDPKRFTVTVRYAGPFGPMPPLSYVLDIADFLDSVVQPEGSLHKVTKQLEKITAEMKRVGSRLTSP